MFWSFITGSGVMTIFFYKGLTINLEIKNTPHLSFAQYMETDQVRDTKFGTNVSNEMLLNAAKCQGLLLLPFLSY